MAEYNVTLAAKVNFLYDFTIEAATEEEAKKIAIESQLGISLSPPGFLGPGKLTSEEREILDNG